MHRHIVGVFGPMCPSGVGAGWTGGNRHRFGVCFDFGVATSVQARRHNTNPIAVMLADVRRARLPGKVAGRTQEGHDYLGQCSWSCKGAK